MNQSTRSASLYLSIYGSQAYPQQTRHARSELRTSPFVGGVNQAIHPIGGVKTPQGLPWQQRIHLKMELCQFLSNHLTFKVGCHLFDCIFLI